MAKVYLFLFLVSLMSGVGYAGYSYYMWSQETVNENCYPVGNVFGIDIYEATHKRTRQKVYVTIDELIL